MYVETDFFNDVATWTQSTRLQLHADNVQMMWYTTKRRQNLLPVVASWQLHAVSIARNLGVFFDCAERQKLEN
jgi:hypothetical protein